MTDNRVVSIELPVTDGQIPIYNASQDKFVAGTAGGGTAATVNGTGVTTGPTATGTTSLIGGYSNADLGHTNTIGIGVQAFTRSDTSIVIGFYGSSGTSVPGTGDVCIGPNIGGSATFGAGGGNCVIVGNGSECWKANSIALGFGAFTTDANSISIGSGADCGASAGDGSTSCICIGSNGARVSSVVVSPNAIGIGDDVDVRARDAIAIGGNSQNNIIPGQLALGPSTFNSNIAGASGPQGVSAIHMVTFVGQTTGSGVGETVTLKAIDGTTTSIPLHPSFTQLCGLFSVEAQAKGIVSGNQVAKAFVQKYLCSTIGNVAVPDPANSTVVVDAAASSWTLSASLDGSSNLSFVFNTGTTTGAIKVVASIRYMITST
jgi:hypothetical protein